MNMTATIAVPAIYGALGFFIAFFLRRAISVAVIALIMYLLFKILSTLNIGVDWQGVGHLGTLISEAGSTVIVIGKSFINSANSTSLILFLVGGIIGLFLAMGGRTTK